MEVGQPEMLRSWLHARPRLRGGAKDATASWQGALQMAETALNWKVRMLGDVFENGPKILDYIQTVHADTAQKLRAAFDSSAAQRLFTELRRPVRMETKRRPVHIAMVASVGVPIFAAKAMATVRSALFFARRRLLHFHLFADGAGVGAVHAALHGLEPGLAARAKQFEVHSEEVILPFFNKLARIIPPDCLGYSSKFGDSGWIRLLAHEVFTRPRNFTQLIYVDAGDFVFLDDPALMLEHAQEFRGQQVAGGPFGGAIPVQVLDLVKMERAYWTRIVQRIVSQEVSQHGGGACGLGEGHMTGVLSRISELWHDFDSHWAVEPREFGGVQGTGGGVRDVWRMPALWDLRVYPGLLDWTSVQVHCPLFSEGFLNMIFEGEIPADSAALKLGSPMVPFTLFLVLGSLIKQPTKKRAPSYITWLLGY